MPKRMVSLETQTYNDAHHDTHYRNWHESVCPEVPDELTPSFQSWKVTFPFAVTAWLLVLNLGISH
jgi:hypothetical protein